MHRNEKRKRDEETIDSGDEADVSASETETDEPAAALPPLESKSSTEPRIQSTDVRSKFFSDYRLDHVNFIKGLDQFWRDSNLKEALTHNKAQLSRIAEMAWDDYQKICALYDAQRVVKIDADHPTTHLKPKEWGLLYEHPLTLFLAKKNNEIEVASRDAAYAVGGKREECLRTIRDLSGEDRTKFQSTLNLPSYVVPVEQTEPHSVIPKDAALMVQVANSCYEEAIQLMQYGVDVNKYSVREGNTALLLAVSKGWMHQDTDAESTAIPSSLYAKVYPQQEIIKALLEHKADVNAPHLANGMTPLHIACLRGDNPELVELLLQNGANVDAKDYQGRTLFDVMFLSYADTKKTIDELTFSQDDAAKISQSFDKFKGPANQSYVATLPTETDRTANQMKILLMLLEHKIKFQPTAESSKAKPSST